MTPKLGLSAARRLKRNNDFVRVRRNGKTYRCRYFALFSTIRASNSADFSSARIGISASKRVGNAVARNRVKRRFRELFRKWQFDIRADVDIVISSRLPAIEAEAEDLEQRFLHAIQYNGLRRRPSKPST
jgi:ribonuclease P protein component